MGFYRRWKPSAAQRRAYAEKMREAEEFDFIKSDYPIREGCFVKWVDKSTNEIFCGTIRKSTYGKDGQHTFTIDKFQGGYKCVKGRNLYDRLLAHDPGEIAKDKDHYLNNRNKKLSEFEELKHSSRNAYA